MAFEVDPADCSHSEKGVRLDQYLSLKLPDFSRTHLQKLIDDGQVLVNEKPGKSGLKVKGGELIEVAIPPLIPLDLEPENIPLDIVFQDQCLAVINKPAGMVVHPGAGVTTGTLVNALLFHLRDSLSGISGTMRPGIVHRLDKDTSGLIVVAKEDQAHRDLAAQIKAKTAARVYVALLEGTLPGDVGTVDKPIGRHPTKRKQMAVVEGGRRAVSHFKVLKRFSKYTLTEVSLETGRTHQIRVHMSTLNCPVVGDLVYNRKNTGNTDARKKLGLIGQALHATRLSFNHPNTGRLLEFEAPLPEDFSKLLESLS